MRRVRLITNKRAEFTQSDLKAVLLYDPDTGEFRWLATLSSKGPAGSIAGTNKDGYVNIGLGGRLYRAHRLAWLYVHGEWPPRHLDHINRDRADNRIVNLRLADLSQNSANSKRSRSNTSGFKGVVWNKQCQKWQARIQLHGHVKHLGLFETPEAAHEAYKVAAGTTFGEYARAE